jgi:hypothetical protein
MTIVSSKLLQKINDNPIYRDEMRVYLGSLNSNNEQPSHANCIKAGMSTFNNNTDKCFWLNTRLDALNRILSSGELQGWVNDSGEEDFSYIPENVFIAAGVTPLVNDGQKMSFRKDDLLKKAFQVGTSH